MTIARAALALLLLGSGLAHAADETWHGADGPYLKRVHESIHRRWTGFIRELDRMPEFASPGLKAVVALTVEPDGAMSKIDLVTGSGLRGFDEAPVDLLREIGRLPAPPVTLHSDDGKTYVEWTFQRREPPGCSEGKIVQRQLPLDRAIPQLVSSGREAEVVARIEALRKTTPGGEAAHLATYASALARAAMVSAEPARRAGAAAVLGHLADGEPGLVKLAGDADRKVRQAAIEALGRGRGSEAGRKAMIAALGGEDRPLAARALGEIKDPSVKEALRASLAAGQSPVEVTGALLKVDERAEVIKQVKALLEGKDHRLAGAQAAHLLAAAELGDALVAALAGAGEELKVELMAAIGAGGAKVPPAARKALYRGLLDGSAKVRAAASEAIAEVGDKSAATRSRLVDLIADADPPVRAAASIALARLSGEASIDELMRMVRDKSPQARAALGAALVRHKVAGVARLLARLEADPEPSVREAITDARRAQGAAPQAASPAELTDRFLQAVAPLDRLTAAAAWLAAR